jgi:multicomponent Na+:H+ antiporter subunit G
VSAEWSEALTASFIVVAAFLCAAAGIGLLRFPDVLSRLHAATKPQILGLGLIVVDVAVSNVSLGTVAFAIAILFFQGLTAPISAHMVGRAAYRGDHLRRDLIVTDELADAVRRADARSEGRREGGEPMNDPIDANDPLDAHDPMDAEESRDPDADSADDAPADGSAR